MQAGGLREQLRRLRQGRRVVGGLPDLPQLRHHAVHQRRDRARAQAVRPIRGAVQEATGGGQ